MKLDWNWVLIIAGALMVLVEVLMGGFAGFDLVLTGSAIAIGGAIGLLTANTTVGFILASALAILYVAVGRRWVRARFHRHETVRSNADAVLGERARVMVRVAEHAPGQVKVKDEVWRAVPAPGVTGPFEPETIVTVEGVDGVTLQVR